MIRPYEKSDFDEVKGWFQDREMNHIRETLLPEFGFIEPGVAAGFLHRTDSKVCILEGFVTNRSALGAYRHQALDGIVDACVKKAKELGFQRICAFSIDESIIGRAEKHGFVATTGFTLLAKEIE